MKPSDRIHEIAKRDGLPAPRHPYDPPPREGEIVYEITMAHVLEYLDEQAKLSEQSGRQGGATSETDGDEAGAREMRWLAFGTEECRENWDELAAIVRERYIAAFRFARDLGKAERDAEVRELREKLASMTEMRDGMIELHRNAMESVELCTNERREAEERAEKAEARVRELEAKVAELSRALECGAR